MKQSQTRELFAIVVGVLVGGYVAHKYTKAKCLEAQALANANFAKTLRELSPEKALPLELAQ